MPETKHTTHHCPIRQIGDGKQHHFFGYYNKTPWDVSGQYLLAQRVPMITADLTGTEVAEVGYFDLENNDTFHAIGSTTAWNWQMGSQLQWLGKDSQNRQIIYNTRTDNSSNIPYPNFNTTIYNLASNEKRNLPLPVYVASPDGNYALCVDYARFQVTHPTIGYNATNAEPTLDNAPNNDGIHRMDIVTGEANLIISLEALRNNQPLPSMDKAIHWVTHLEINPASSRFLFIHRWTERVEDETCFLHRLYTADPDGSDLTLLECTDHPLPQLDQPFDPNHVGTFDYEKSEFQISHPAWKNNHQVICWGPHKNNIHYHLYDDPVNHSDLKVTIIGQDLLTENGHMSYSPNAEWLLSDTYPDSTTNERILFLYHLKTNHRYDIGSFYTDPHLGKPNRCDLHPRWHPNGQQVCIDSVHQHQRQMYILDVGEILN